MMTFRLSDEFVASYAKRPVPWGYADAAGNALGEITFLRTYSRKKPCVHGNIGDECPCPKQKERWHDVCRRVVEGMFTIQKNHAKDNRLPWSDVKAQRTAEDAFDRLFHLKWSPPGRGLWMMGTPLVMEQNNSAALQNCSFVSTADMTFRDPAGPFVFLMEASMLGVGVGFDTKGADKGFKVFAPTEPATTYVIPDSREGWVESVKLLIESYLMKGGRPQVDFDYSLIRPAGAPIRTFGGTAAGPEPLMKLHQALAGVFEKRAAADNPVLTTVDILDIANLIGVCVVSGNVRRSAELAMGSLRDADFLNAKNADLFPDRNSYDPAKPGWGWMSNNSVEVKVGDDLSGIVDGIRRNGEPGVIWMDVTRNFGRLGDPADGKDHRAAGFNPCVTEDTWVLTADGPRQVRDLIGRPFTALVNGKPFQTLSRGFWLTGTNREVFDLTTEEGYTVRLTGNHQILTATRGWVEAAALKPSEQIALHEHESATWDGRGTEGEGYLLGHLWGDGTLVGNRAVLSVWGDRPELRSRIEGIAAALPHRSDWTGFHEIPGRDEWRLRSTALGSLARTYGIVQGHKKITDTVEQASSAFQIGFLRGAFDTDGSVEGSLAKGVSIRLSQSDRDQLVRAQRMLARLGILSSIYRTHDTRRAVLPDGRGGVAEYTSQASWRLAITGEDAFEFMARVGFADPEKASAWKAINADRKRAVNQRRPFATFEELVPAGEADVYDVTVEDVHAFDANGLYVHNCAEQPLESFEMCTLVETYLNRHDSFEDFKRTLKVAYMYGKTVTLIPTHWPQTNAIMQRNRRIGTSISGIANFADNRGISELRRWMDEGYATVKHYDRVYSEWLCVRESIRTTTVKPSGCRPWDALTTTDQGVLTLEELFAASGHVAGADWQEFDGYRALQGAAGASAITKTYDNGKADVLAVALSYGMEVRSTENHQWWVARRYDRNAPQRWTDVNEWVRADCLRPGDVLEVTPGVYDSASEAPLLHLDARSLSMRGDATDIAQPAAMTPDLGWLLGYLWGDGAMSPAKYRIRFIDAITENLQKAQRVLADTFGITAEIRPASGARKAQVLEVGSKMLWHWLIKNGVWKYFADDIDVIPEVVRRSSTETLLAFLAGLVDADGHVAARTSENVVILSTASTDFARHVQDVALAAGVVFGRSHNTGGSNLQPEKSMWLMCLAPETLPERLDVMARHSTKMANPPHPELPWSPHLRGTSRNRILGKVESVEPLGQVETFDVEVAETHWYYAGGVKSHNTVSIVAGESPGVHWAPGGEYFERRIRFGKDDPIVTLFRNAGYLVEPASESPDTTVVIAFPIRSAAKRSEKDVTLFEKAHLAATAQRHWSDNSVSVTLSFDSETEGKDVGPVLAMYEGQLKTVSFLPTGKMTFPQMPYTPITPEQYRDGEFTLFPVDLSPIYEGLGVEAVGEEFCTTDACEIKDLTKAIDAAESADAA